MNATLNLAIVFAGPIIVTTATAIILWLVHRDPVRLGGRLRRWDFWAVLAPYTLFALLMSLSMALQGDYYPIATALASVVLFAGLPLGTWAWLRFDGRGLTAAYTTTGTTGWRRWRCSRPSNCWCSSCSGRRCARWCARDTGAL